MSFLRMRRHARRPVTVLSEDKPAREEMMPVTVKGETFTSAKAYREYLTRKHKADQATKWYLQNRAMQVVDGSEHRVKHGASRNAKWKQAVQVRSRHQPTMPDNVPDGFTDEHFEVTLRVEGLPDTVRRTPSATLADRNWTGQLTVNRDKLMKGPRK